MLDRVGVEKVHADDWEKMVESMEDVVHRGNKGFRGNGTASISAVILITEWQVNRYRPSRGNFSR